MPVQTRRKVFLAASWQIFVCSWVSVALLDGAEAERRERLLHVPGAVLLQGYPQDDALYIARDGEELTLQPPGPNRAGHHTYPSLSRDGTFIATSYVKSPNPHYREGIAAYSLIEKQWKQYDSGDFHYVWAITISPDGSALAFKTQRHGSHVPQLLLLDLKTGEMTVMIERFNGSAPMSWSPDGRYITFEHRVRQPDPTVDVDEYEIRIRDVRNQRSADWCPAPIPHGRRPGNGLRMRTAPAGSLSYIRMEQG